MIETSDLNVGGGLPTSELKDGTSASQKGGTGGGLQGVTGSALKEGVVDFPSPRIPTFSDQNEGGATKDGDIFAYGGFLGRPQGTQR
jgi:hypothetical protein